MHITSFRSLFPLLTAICTASPTQRSTTYSDIKLYAYGTNITGIPISFGNTDGLAYLTSSNQTVGYTSLTWNISSSGEDAWTVSTTNGTEAGTFYIVDSDSSYMPAGFLAPHASTTTNVTTLGFSLYGTVVVLTTDTTLESQFWARLEADGVWSLRWNSDGSSQVDSVPVTLKTTGLVDEE